MLPDNNQYIISTKQHLTGIVRKENDSAMLVRKLVLSEITTTKGIFNKTEISEESKVHETRKGIKRIRSLIRLLKYAYSETQFQDMDDSLKNAGRLMTELRESVVNYKTFIAFINKSGDKLNSTMVEQIVCGLESKVNLLYKQNKDQSAIILSTVKQEIDNIENQIHENPIQNFNHKDLVKAVESAFLKTIESYEKAIETPDTEIIHKWRRQAKFLLLQFRHSPLLAFNKFDDLRHQLETLTDLLGKEHDLAIMNEYILNSFELSADDELQLNQLIDKNRSKLQDKAFEFGKKLFSNQ